MFTRIMAFFMSAVQLLLFTFSGSTHILNVNKYEQYQTFEGFGTSLCWWAQMIDDENAADEIARKLYDKESGLGLTTVRYNIGAGENDTEDSRVWLRERRSESFYYYNEKTGEYEYDFTRDANARRVLDKAVEYGAQEVILFCNSPHYSMTLNGHAYADTVKTSNLPKENYAAFVDYVLTIADWFVSQGYPVKAISPINEPQWDWGGDYVSQEGCYFEPDDCVELLEMFAVEMQKRGCSYELRGPESGQLTWQYYDYIDKFLQSDILRNFCSYYSGHTYWMDGDADGKRNFVSKLENEYPGVKFEMSEWCELPQSRDVNSIESGLWFADVIIEDLSLMNAVSWSSWTAYHGDGLLDGDYETVNELKRYPVQKQFSAFIKPGMHRVEIADSEDGSSVSSVCFTDGSTTVIVLANNAESAESIKITGVCGKRQAYVTDESRNCESADDIINGRTVNLPAQSVVTVTISK